MPGHGVDERMTLGFFADHVTPRRDRRTITQYREAPGFPQADDDGRYRLGDLLEFFNTGRPGMPAAGQPGRALSMPGHGVDERMTLGFFADHVTPRRDRRDWSPGTGRRRGSRRPMTMAGTASATCSVLQHRPAESGRR